MSDHTDLIDLLAASVVPFVLLAAVLLRTPRWGRFAAGVGLAGLGLLVIDLAFLVPVPDGPVDRMRWSIAAFGAVVAALPLLLKGTPARTTPGIASLAGAFSFGIVAFWLVLATCTTAADGGSLSAASAGRRAEAARMALFGTRGQVTIALAVLAACVAVARGKAADGPLQRFAGLCVGSVFLLPVGVLADTASAAVVGIAYAVPYCFFAAPPRRGWTDYWTAQLEAGWPAFVALIAVVAVPALGLLGTDTGWLKLGPVSILPMTSCYLLVPLAASMTLSSRRPRGPEIVLEATVLALVLGVLAAQGETGLLVLTGAAWVAVRAAAAGTLRQAGFIFGGGLIAVVVGYFVTLSQPGLFGRAEFVLGRLAASNGALEDLAQFQAALRADLIREAGVLGLGVRDGSGFFALPAWSDDYLPVVIYRYLGFGGLLGAAVAAALPAVAVLRTALGADFRHQERHSRAFLMAAVPWSAMHGGGTVLILGGALGVLPLTGVTWGFVPSALNHVVFAVPFLLWWTARAAEPEPSPRPWGGLRRVAQAPGAVVFAGVLTVVGIFGVRAASDADAVVLPLQRAPTVEFERWGAGVARRTKRGLEPFRPGQALQVGNAIFAVGGVEVRLDGLRWSPAELRRGVSLGAAGPNAPSLSPFHRWMPERVAHTNDVWLTLDPRTRWREGLFVAGAAGPEVVAATSSGRVAVVRAGSDACVSQSAANRCPIQVGDEVEFGRAARFLVESVQDGLRVRWLDGPRGWLVPTGRALQVGGRALTPRQQTDQIWHYAGPSGFALLAEAGVFELDSQGRLAVTGPPQVDESAPIAERRVQRAAVGLFGNWLRPPRDPASCAAGWVWRQHRDPTAEGARCVSDTVLRHVVIDGGRVGPMRRRPTRLLSSTRTADALVERGSIVDVHGTRLTVRTTEGYDPVHPSLVPIVGVFRGAGSGNSSGLQFTFHRILSGRSSRLSTAAEWRRRWRRLPRQNHGEVRLTLSLPLQEWLADAVQAEAELLARKAAERPTRADAELRSCREYFVSGVISASDGGLRAVATATAWVDDDGAVRSEFGSSSGRRSCLPADSGPVRALTYMQPIGSTFKPVIYSGAITRHPELFSRQGGQLFVGDRQDPGNTGPSGWLEDDDGVLTQVRGRPVSRVHNYTVRGVRVVGGVFEVVDAIARSLNVVPAWLSGVLGGDEVLRLVEALDLTEEIDLMPLTGELELDRQLDRRSRDVLWGAGARWSEAVRRRGGLHPQVVPKVAVGQEIRVSGLGQGRVASAVAGEGIYSTPRLVEEVRWGDARTTAFRSVRRAVFSAEAAKWTWRGMHAAVNRRGGTAYTAARRLPEEVRQRLSVKTGTPDLEWRNQSLPSHKTALALFERPDGEVLTFAVFALHAQHLHDTAAVEVVLEVVERLEGGGAAQDDP